LKKNEIKKEVTKAFWRGTSCAVFFALGARSTFKLVFEGIDVLNIIFLWAFCFLSLVNFLAYLGQHIKLDSLVEE